jgi:hypothetical protein
MPAGDWLGSECSSGALEALGYMGPTSMSFQHPHWASPYGQALAHSRQENMVQVEVSLNCDYWSSTCSMCLSLWAHMTQKTVCDRAQLAEDLMSGSSLLGSAQI